MGIYGVAMAAASVLWGYGVGRVLLMGLRCLTYEDLWVAMGREVILLHNHDAHRICIALHSHDAHAVRIVTVKHNYK